MLVAEKKNLKVEIEAPLKVWFDELCAQKNIKLVDAIEGIIRFLGEMDDAGQSVVMGQLQPSSELIALVMREANRRYSSRNRGLKSGVPARSLAGVATPKGLSRGGVPKA